MGHVSLDLKAIPVNERYKMAGIGFGRRVGKV